MSFGRKITAGQKRLYYEDRMNVGEKSDIRRVMTEQNSSSGDITHVLLQPSARERKNH